MTDLAGAIRWMRIALVAIWALDSIHHIYGAIRYQNPERLLNLALLTVILGITLAFLRRYEQTGGRRSYLLFSGITLAWWVGVLGLVQGFYGHILKNVLYFSGAIPAAAMPGGIYLPLAKVGEFVVPTDLFYEGTGILVFVFAAWVAVAWRRLTRAQNRMGS